MKTIALIDYGSGNLHSAARALRLAAGTAKKTREVRITRDPDALRHCDRIVLPGVGHFGQCADALRAADGLVDALEEAVRDQGKPFLGICVGMQLLAERGLEDGVHAGLGWLQGEVAPLPAGPELRIPHMGWNALTPAAEAGFHPLLSGLAPDAHAYFVHSYALRGHDPADVAATAEHGTAFPALVAKDNIAGTQFHPEKSQRTGLQLLANWVLWQP